MRGPIQDISQILARAVDGAVTRMSQQPHWTEVELKTHGQDVRLLAVWAGVGRRREVEQAIAKMRSPWPERAVVVARRLPPASIELLGKRNANWADATGNARIVGAGLVVLREASEGRPATRELKWSPSSVTVAEAILARSWPRGIGTGALASLTGWSPGQVSQVLHVFDSQGWTAKVGPQRGPRARRRLIDQDGMLDAWAEWTSAQAVERRMAHGLFDQPLALLDGQLGEALDENVRWALTGWGASELLAPIMTAVPTLQIRVAEDDFYGSLTQAIDDSGLQEVQEGGAVEFWSTGPSGLHLAERHGDVPVASAPRVYADLIGLGGRGEDAAQHVRQSAIEPLHRPLATRPPSRQMAGWRHTSLERLETRVHQHRDRNPYEHGSWSVAYRLLGSDRTPSVSDFREMLLRATGRETGWPVWSDFGDPVQIVDNVIECWVQPHTFADPAHRDFWRADPHGLLFLLRGYEEDGDELTQLPPGTTLDLTFPIWRIGECLLHAARLARLYEAERVELSVRWDGLEGRTLRALGGSRRYVPAQLRATETAVESNIEIHADAVEEILADAVRALLDPLYSTFGFLQPTDELYRTELDQLRRP